MKFSTRPTGAAPIKPHPAAKNFRALYLQKYGAPLLRFPKTLNTPRKRVQDQGSRASCTKQATELAAEYQDGPEMSAEWAFDEICAQIGDPNPSGLDPKDAMTFNVKVGSLPEKFIGLEQPRVIAEQFRKSAYLPIPFINDWFDTAKSALVKGQAKNQVVIACGRWYTEYDAKFIPLNHSNFAGY